MTSTPTNTSPSLMTTLTPRQFVAPLAQDTPRQWLPGNPVVSAILNAYSVLVPANENFYIRTLKACMPRVHEVNTRWMIVNFVHQEAQHGVGHRQHWSVLDAQGYRFRRFEKWVDILTFKTVERIVPLHLRLSAVSCIEHINAYLAYEFLQQNILESAHPSTRALFEWHFAEEIEHKHVTYEVLRELAGGYLVRLLGALLAAPIFYLLMTIGTLKFLRQDGLLFKAATWRQFGTHLWRANHMALRTLRHLWNYLRPGFHPNQLDDRALARRVIERYSTAPSIWLQPTARGKQQAGPAVSGANPGRDAA